MLFEICFFRNNKIKILFYKIDISAYITLKLTVTIFLYYYDIKRLTQCLPLQHCHAHGQCHWVWCLSTEIQLLIWDTGNVGGIYIYFTINLLFEIFHDFLYTWWNAGLCNYPFSQVKLYVAWDTLLPLWGHWWPTDSGI